MILVLNKKAMELSYVEYKLVEASGNSYDDAVVPAGGVRAKPSSPCFFTQTHAGIEGAYAEIFGNLQGAARPRTTSGHLRAGSVGVFDV